MSETYDFIIVGSGSAGSVLADRLTDGTGYRVLVLEAGGSDRRFWIEVPIGYGKTYFDEKVNWKYGAEADPGLNGRREYWPRGKVVGGSSSINALVYIRGQLADYDDWSAAGNLGWSGADVLPFFKKSEGNVIGDNPWHSVKGPLTVSSYDPHPVNQHLFDGLAEMGLPANPDFNGEHQEGYGLYQLTTRNGRRCSAAKAFLHPAIRRGGVRLETGAHAERLLFEGRRAVGVCYRQNGTLHEARARAEVIVAGGTINSPQLLQLSGIGAAGLLRDHGIDVQHDLPAVGQNVQDHLFFPTYFRTRKPTLNNELNSAMGQLLAGIRYVLTRSGPLSLSVNQGGAFFRSRADLMRANMQLYLNLTTFSSTAQVKNPKHLRLDTFSGMGLNVSPCRPTSRGSINIASPDPYAYPVIRPNYLSTNHDIQDALEGIGFVRRLARTKAMSELIVSELLPWPDEADEVAMVDHLRNRGRTTFHPTSSCIMGPDAALAVVDSRLRVHGIEGLRVIDASVFPTMVSGNTNAPTIMVAEKGADMVLADNRSGGR